MQIGIKEARPSYVTFGFAEQEDRTASQAAGHYVPKEVAFAYITPQGSKDRFEQQATEWLEKQREAARQGRIPQAWYDHYKASYEAWLKGQELPVNGTPLRTWPPASKAQVNLLINIGILTVEDLANCNEEAIARMGMGGRALVELAQTWLLQAKQVGVPSMELDNLRRTNAALTSQVASMQNQIARLAAAIPAAGSLAGVGEGQSDESGTLSAESLLKDL